jgi:hypothetical protein
MSNDVVELDAAFDGRAKAPDARLLLGTVVHHLAQHSYGQRHVLVLVDHVGDLDE